MITILAHAVDRLFMIMVWQRFCELARLRERSHVQLWQPDNDKSRNQSSVDSSMQNEGFSTFGVQNRNYGTHKPLLRITVGIIMEKDPKCAKTLISHTTVDSNNR